MAAVHKAIVFAMHKVTLFLVHEIIFPAICIESTRSTISITRAHQAYRVSKDHQKAAAHLNT